MFFSTPSSIWAEIEEDKNCFLTSHGSYFNSRYLALNDLAAHTLSWYQLNSYWIGVSFAPGNISHCFGRGKKATIKQPKNVRTCSLFPFPPPPSFSKGFIFSFTITDCVQGRFGVCLVDKHEMEEHNVVPPELSPSQVSALWAGFFSLCYLRNKDSIQQWEKRSPCLSP